VLRIAVSIAVAGSLVACEKRKEETPAAKPAVGAMTKEPVVEFGWYDVPASAVLATELEAQAKIAAAGGRRPVAYLHADWCGPCKAIEKTVRTDERMVAAFKGMHVISLDVDAIDGEAIDRHGLRSDSIPVFFTLDGNGKPTGARIDGGAWNEDVPANMAPPLAAFFAAR
jgi:thiol:disulfide interchange protein